MPLLNRGLDEAAHGREAVRIFGRGSNDLRDFHSPNTKNPGVAGALTGFVPISVVPAGEHGDEMK